MKKMSKFSLGLMQAFLVSPLKFKSLLFSMKGKLNLEQALSLYF
jgi:hypothetical protein